MAQWKKDDLLFVPLGGSNEIGMNANLYHYKGKWLMIDLGAGFADTYYPGVQMLAPDLRFLYERKEDFLGVVLTHAHEDHVGSVGYLWDKLECPIYATPFTASMARSKLQERGWLDKAKIIEKKPGSSFDIGPFSLEMLQITHSIPEMNGIVLRTEHGTVFHTGDWKFDPNPVIGTASDFDKLKKIGDEGVLAMVCDSTNVFTEKHSGSEGDLFESLSGLIAKQQELVIVTTFASNVARMHTIAKAAEANDRKVVLAGWSLHRISTFAKEAGYLEDISPFISDTEMKSYKRDKLLVMCTGCQGESNAAMNKIAEGNHPFVRLRPRDTVIFSSKIIPGNEKSLFRLFNKFVRLGVEVLTEKDHFVHVSGHPSREELTKMYDLVRPKVAVPVHGEPVQLHEHVKLAKSIGIEQQVEIENGQLVRLAPGEVKTLEHVHTGYLAVDGRLLQPRDGDVMKMRRRLQNDGIIVVTLVLNMGGGLALEPSILAAGVIDATSKAGRQFIRYVTDELVDILDDQGNTSNDRMSKTARNTVRRLFKEETGKRPPVEIQIARV